MVNTKPRKEMGGWRYRSTQSFRRHKMEANGSFTPLPLYPVGNNTSTQWTVDSVGSTDTLEDLKTRLSLVPAGYGITTAHSSSLAVLSKLPSKISMSQSTSARHISASVSASTSYYLMDLVMQHTALRTCLTPWRTTEETAEMSTIVQCWQQGYWQRQAKRSVRKTKTDCGKQPIRTNTFPISAANKWRQERVHSTEKTTLIPSSPQTLLPCRRPSAQWDTVLVCWPRSAMFDWSSYRTDKKHRPKQTRAIR